MFFKSQRINIKFNLTHLRRISLIIITHMLLFSSLNLNSCTTTNLVVPPVTESATHKYSPGKFVWHDLMTNDVAAVKKFYSDLFGWEFIGDDDPKARYTTIIQNGRPIGGIVFVADLEDGSNPSQWMSYLSVQDVDKAVEFYKKNSGNILRETWNQNGRGRMAIVQDSQGALLALLRSDVGDPEDKEPVSFGWLWNELLTTDAETARSYYESLVGYVSESIPVHDDFKYYTLKKDDKVRAGIGQVPWKGVKPNWLVYILVEEPLLIVERVKSLGGEVLLPPSEDIRKGSVAIVSDPSGGVFAIQKWPYE